MEGHNELMHCPTCHKNYCIQGNRLPILLKCAHSICDYCFKNEVKLKSEIVCRRCDFVSKMTKTRKGKDNMDEFPVHYYIAGILVQEKLNMIRDSNNITDLTFKVDVNIAGKKNCDKCGIKEAVIQCDQCEDSFCNGCDKVVHNITTGSKKHRRKRVSTIPLPIAMLDTEVSRCEQHNLDISYSCNDCKAHLCSECILQSHKDHSFQQLKDIHESAIDVTYDLLEKVQEIIPRFSYSQSKINEICTKMESKAQLCQKTSKSFETMFGTLQLSESENRIKIREFCVDQIGNLRKSMDDLTKRINDVKEFIRIKSTLSDINIKVNLNEINGALNEIISTPWYMKKDIFESIDKHEFEKCNPKDLNGLINLNLDEFPKIELLRTDQVSSDELSDIDFIISKSDLAVKFRLKDNRADSFDKLSIMGSTFSVASRYSKDSSSERKDGRKRTQKVLYTPDAGKKSTVIISHMISPASFYVQLIKNREVFDFFKRVCEKWVPQAHLVTEVKMDQVYLTPVFNDTTIEEWKRVQIKEMKDPKKLLVFFLDYGNSGTVSIDNLKVISDKIKKFLPFAFHCRLNSTFPRQNVWTLNDTKRTMEILATYKFMQIEVRRKLEHVYVVDLFLFSEKLGSRVDSFEGVLSGLNKIARHNQSSQHSEQVVDLTFESEIIIISDETVTVDKGAKNGNEEVPRKQSGDNVFRIEVTVLRCENPFNILLSLPNRLLELNDLSKKMQEFYAIEENLKPLNEADLKCDTVCLAFSNTCNKWCRAKICQLYPEIEKVAVYFFDDGVREDLATNVIYELHKDFLTAFSGVIKGFLAGLRPPCRNDTWPKQTCERLQQLLTDNKVYMTKMGSAVDKSLPVDFCFEDCVEMEALKPSIFQWKSVREMLINEGLACLESQFRGVINETEEQIMSELTRFNEQISDNDDQDGDGVAVKDAKWLPSKRITERIFFAKPMSVDMEAFIYLFNVNEGYKSINKIRDVLNTMLINSKPNLNRAWKKGDICSAKYFADNQFYRAEITEVEAEDDDKCSVEFIDYGNVETCLISDLREEVFLLDIPKQVHKCRVKDLNDLLKPWENDEVFLKQILDYVHAVIVEKQVSAELLEYDSSGYPVLNICVGENLITLVQDELVRLKNKDARRFTLLDYDKKSLSINVLVTDIISCSEVILLLKKEFEPFESEFDKMFNHMKLQAKSQEKVTDFQVDKVCIAFHTESSTWQRAQIYTKLNSYTNLVNVYLVDLGILREINKDLIREIRNDWLKLPVKSYIASLHGVQESVHSSNGQQNDFVNKLKSCIILGNEYYGVVTGSAEGILKCDIYDMDRRISVYGHLK